ncbi:MAG TPA: ATP-binding protein [Gemmatimonadaceae bacterium]|nr:ATP-binding protein [Gemmatimonadaceae bacterium]
MEPREDPGHPGGGIRGRRDARAAPIGADIILDAIGDAVLAIDGDWRIVHWNAAAERLTGIARDGALGRDFTSVGPAFAESDLAGILRDVMRRRVAAELREWSFPGNRHGGGRGAYDVRVAPSDGGGIVAMLTEVGERVRRDRELAERSAENEALRRLARQMAAVPDSATLLHLLCEAAREQCGADGASVLKVIDDQCEFVAADGLLELLRGRRLPLRGSFTERLLASPAPQAIASAAYHSDSAAFNAIADELGIGAIIVTPLLDHGKVMGVLSTTRRRGAGPFDDRDQERMRVIADHASIVLRKSELLERAQAANEAKMTFLATISHELRTPLTALTGYGELLADGVLGEMPEVQRDAVERMRAVTQQLTLMIDEVLAFTALDEGREVIASRATDGAEILDRAVAVLEPLAERKGLDFVRLAAFESAPLVTDPEKARQILVNLGGNAIKFTDRGEVSFSVACIAGEVRFDVRDTGPGIPPDALPKLFRPFSQLDTGLTRRHGGTGLGLYVCRRLAEMLGGRIEVESAVGEGSRFTLVLPGGLSEL